MKYTKPDSALFFHSPSMEKDFYASDLCDLSIDELENLECEVSLALAKAEGDLAWLKMSTPDQWPDEGWAQRICRYSSCLGLFHRLLIQAKKPCLVDSNLASIKKHNQDLLNDLQKKKQFVQMLLIAVEDRYGRNEMLNLKRIARALAETKQMAKPSSR